MTFTAVPELLLIDPGARAARRTAALARHGNVVSTSMVGRAAELLCVRPVDVIITEDAIADGTAVDVCRLAAEARSRPAVLVTAPHIGRIPAVIAAGCDGILLKPVDMNLLCERVRRLVDARHRLGRNGGRRVWMQRDTHGTIEYWPGISCRRCAATGVFSFEFASHRRSWYTCIECGDVWLAARREG
jgi:DNA-binding response OmpR family regulator